jgi:hypothetical protein
MTIKNAIFATVTAITIGASTVANAQPTIDAIKAKDNGGWITVEGVVSGGRYDYINAVVECDDKYVGNGFGRISASGTFSMDVFDTPPCGNVSISRVTADSIPVEFAPPKQTPKVQHSAVWDPKEPAERCMEPNEIMAVQALVGVQADGAIGPKTIEAIKAWNVAHGIDHEYISEHMIDTAMASRN